MFGARNHFWKKPKKKNHGDHGHLSHLSRNPCYSSDAHQGPILRNKTSKQASKEGRVSPPGQYSQKATKSDEKQVKEKKDLLK
mmetsp:Transcript_2497/g.4072  ORF Transcript_2497/g.4072 Transcript_2497/m.4072 type:complete len:83 (-) Transcript_2497:544-792(-)